MRRDGDRSAVPVVEVFAELRDVSQENRKGFGCGALKVKGKIFAVMSSKRQFVVKLPKYRVDELVSRGKGQRFERGHGEKRVASACGPQRRDCQTRLLAVLGAR
jgi:hypothetical protein